MATTTEKATTPLPNETASAPEGATIKVQTVERAMTGGTTLLVECGPDTEARKKIVADLRKSATFLKIGLDISVQLHPVGVTQTERETDNGNGN